MEEIKIFAEKIGYPVILKASGGGGGHLRFALFIKNKILKMPLNLAKEKL